MRASGEGNRRGERRQAANAPMWFYRPSTMHSRPIEWLRRHLAWFAVLAIAALVASDWPFGWAFWVLHPLVAAMVAGLALLVMTLAVVDAVLRRREAARWVDVARGGGVAMVTLYNACILALLEATGLDTGQRLRPNLHHYLVPAHRAAVRACPNNWNQDEVRELAFDAPRLEQWLRDTLGILLLDPSWNKEAASLILELEREQELTLARWVTAFSIVGDEGSFRRAARITQILDREEAIQEHLSVIEDSTVSGRPHDGDEAGRSRARVIYHWLELLRAVGEENRHWQRHISASSEMGLDDLPYSTELMTRDAPTVTHGAN